MSYNATRAEGVNPKKYKELMAIAVALTMQCVYCIELHQKEPLKPALPKRNLSKPFTWRLGSPGRS